MQGLLLNELIVNETLFAFFREYRKERKEGKGRKGSVGAKYL